MNGRFRKLCSFLLVYFLVTGCTLGPKFAKKDPFSYNTSIHYSMCKQMLLNLIRLKYRETPVFLQTDSISTQYKFSSTAGGTFTLPAVSPNTYGANIQGHYTEQPTVTYVPLQGQDYLERILSVVDLSRFFLLFESGWNIERLLRLMVEQLGPLHNEPTLSIVSKEQMENYEKFLTLTKLWHKLQKRGDLRLFVRPRKHRILKTSIAADSVTTNIIISANEKGYEFEKEPTGTYTLYRKEDDQLIVQLRYSKEEEELAALLEVAPKQVRMDQGMILEEFSLSVFGEGEAVERGPEGLPSVPVKLRSLADIMFYLSLGIETPKGHEEKTPTKIYRDFGGDLIAAFPAVEEMLHVETSRFRPLNAYVSVKHAGYFFYIRNDNIHSKDSFALLQLLFTLQSGNTPSKVPILTLPLN